MKELNVKYSIIMPCKNGGKYLETCVNSIINQDFYDYELIISDDSSTDNTNEYLNQLNHPNIKIIRPEISLSMAEHWEWALSHSKGEWVLFVGQDDGLQSYFFKLADMLTDYADKNNIRTIMSERAYFYWPGFENLFGQQCTSYIAISRLKIHNFTYQIILSLLGFQTYFHLPQMYTTSLFKRTIIDEAKEKQNGKLFVTHPQDANLAAVAFSLEKNYLKSYIPLGWVGTSPKSAGMAIISPTDTNNKDIKNIKEDYLEKTKNSDLKLHPLIGSFSLGSTNIYLWGALLQTNHLRKNWTNKLILSRLFKIIMFSGTLSEIKNSKKLNFNLRIDLFKDLLKINQCNYTTINLLSNVINIFYIYNKFYRRVESKIFKLLKPYFFCNLTWNEEKDITLNKVSENIKIKIESLKLLDKENFYLKK